MRRSRLARTLLPAAFLVLPSLGCAGTGASSSFERGSHADVFTRSEVDEPATLIDCSDFKQQEPYSETDFVDVTVPMVVGVDGAVERVGMPRAQRVSDRDVLDRALSLARSCTFQPAQVDDRFVRFSTEVRFRMGRRGG